MRVTESLQAERAEIVAEMVAANAETDIGENPTGARCALTGLPILNGDAVMVDESNFDETRVLRDAVLEPAPVDDEDEEADAA